MQPPNHTMSPMAPISPASITTEQIQKYLDENKQLILAILDNQNLGKLAECAQYQTQLQKNLLYLAAIADAQSPAPTAHPQMARHPATQQGSPFGQQQQQQQQQQTPLYPSRAAQPFNLQQIQHHQTMFPGHAGTKPIGNTSELLPGNALQATRRMHGEAAECGGLPERT